jgi:hypothetical protein
MINIELSKVLPNRAHEFFAALLPGLFFVISVGLANPELALRVVKGAAAGFALGHYATLAVMMFLAFVVGEAFILVVALTQFLFGYAYRVKLFVYCWFCRWPLRPLFRWLVMKPRWQTSPTVSRWRMVIETRAQMGFQPEVNTLRESWLILARRLMQARCGIEPDKINDTNWDAFYPFLSTPAVEDIRGLMSMIAVQATGWAGIVATRLAPLLRNKYYLGLCVFLILNGLLHEYYVAMRRVDPRVSCGIAIRALLKEFPRIDLKSDSRAEES